MSDRSAKDDVVVMSLRKALELSASRTVFPLGSPGLDGLLDGGLRTGEMVEVFGASNTGKTQLATQATLSVAALGKKAAFVDTEGTFRPERLAAMAVARSLDPEKVLGLVYSIRADDTRRQFQAAESIRKGGELADCKLVVVDTVTKNFTLEYGGNKNAVRRQRVLSRYLNVLLRDAYLEDRAVLLTNRVASVGLDGNSAEVDIGGDTLRNRVQRIVHLTRSGRQVLATSVRDRRPQVALRLGEGGME